MTLQELSDHIKGLLESGVPPTAKLFTYYTRAGLSEGIEVRAEYTTGDKGDFAVADIVCVPVQMMQFGDLRVGDLA